MTITGRITAGRGGASIIEAIVHDQQEIAYSEALTGIAMGEEWEPITRG